VQKSISVVLTALGALAPALAIPAEAIAASSTTYTGAISDFKYGRTEVKISVSDKRLSAITVLYSDTDPRSGQIDTFAYPTLRKEALKANSYKIHAVSGATYTSQAFEKSLYSAMLKAHIG
jgi:uncharacterized protein with FMN-binding domain